MHNNKKYRCRPPQTGEAGFTLIEMLMVIVISSILGLFVFGILTKCIVAQRDMQVRKESNDDALRSMDKINRELREAFRATNLTAVNNMLKFEKKITSCADDNEFVRYARIGTTLTRVSGSTTINGPYNTSSVIATNVSKFVPNQVFGGWVSIDFEFESESGAGDGSHWITNVLPRN